MSFDDTECSVNRVVRGEVDGSGGISKTRSRWGEKKASRHIEIDFFGQSHRRNPLLLAITEKINSGS